jgi:hypothetical protein
MLSTTMSTKSSFSEIRSDLQMYLIHRATTYRVEMLLQLRIRDSLDLRHSPIALGRTLSLSTDFGVQSIKSSGPRVHQYS